MRRASASWITTTSPVRAAPDVELDPVRALREREAERGERVLGRVRARAAVAEHDRPARSARRRRSPFACAPRLSGPRYATGRRHGTG